MPTGNLGGHFKTIEAKKLAEKWKLVESDFGPYMRSYLNRRITLNDVKSMVDEFCYDVYGEYMYLKITPEKRYDTDLNCYTKREFIEFYTSIGEDYTIHWATAPSNREIQYQIIEEENDNNNINNINI